MRPESFPALIRADAGGDGSAAVAALRSRHERGRDNLHTALREITDKFVGLQLELAQLHGAPPARAPPAARCRAGQPVLSLPSAGRVWDRHSKLAHAVSPGEAAALSAEVAATVVGAGRGSKAERVLMPPALTVIGWVRAVDASASRELELKLRLLELLTSTDTGPESPARLAKAARLWCLQPGMDREAVDRLTFIVGSLTVVDD